MCRRYTAVSLLAFFLASPSASADPAVTQTLPAPRSQELVAAQARLRTSPGLQVGLWATDPLVQDVTNFAFDEHGRAYVVESNRRRTSVFDIRNLQPWLEDDYALRSVVERETFLRGKLTPGEPDYPAFVRALSKSKFGDFNRDGRIDWHDLEVEQERIRLVWDADGDGTADTAETYAEGFRGLSSGVAAGVLARGSNVWFTCIPDLWRFPAAPPADGVSASSPAALAPGQSASEKLLTGFGVHLAFGGHDLHGLILGPDGRLYFSIADRGARVGTREGGTVAVPDCGAVYRCEPDGTQLGVVATGLRNPQELAFDDFGNLWTGDNNGDGGDKARWTLVVEGAHYGWSIGWQWLPRMGAWNSERLWHTRESNSAAFILPPVAHIGHGPAGIAHYPGTGLGDRFLNHFFVADFPGGIRHFRVEPDGAFFRVADAGLWMEDNSPTNLTGKLLWNLAPVDLAFPPGGGVMVADAFPSWEKTGTARLWRVSDPALRTDPAIAEVARLLKEGMSDRSTRELASLLAHRDQRIRLESQWTLAARGESSLAVLEETALRGPARLARIHAAWALGQIGRRNPGLAGPSRWNGLRPLLTDSDPAVQEAALRMFGDSRESLVVPDILPLVAHRNPRVAAAAMRALALILPATDAAAFTPDLAIVNALSGALVESHLDDPVVREAKLAIILGLPRSGSVLVQRLESHPDPRAQLVGLLARRRQPGNPGIARHLRSPHPQLVLEAARALHDCEGNDPAPLLEFLRNPELLVQGSPNPWPVQVNFERGEWLTWILRRAVNTAFQQSSRDSEGNARALAAFSARADVPVSVQVESIDALGEWGKPTRRDRVLGTDHPRIPGDPAHARAAVASVWPRLIAPEAPPERILAALRAGAALHLEGFAASLAPLQSHPSASVREEAGRLAQLAVPLTTAQRVALLSSGSLAEQRSALASLANEDAPAATDALVDWMRKLNAGQVPQPLRLDVYQAAVRAGSPPLRSLLAAWTNALPKDDPLAQYRIALHGGDPVAGRKLFAERADWGCQRCHKLRGEGGEVGPELTGIARTRGVDHVLDSILTPNKDIAPGYENVLITRKTGATIAGMVKSETSTELILDAGEDGRVTIPKSDIAGRQRGLSPMIEGLGDLITLHELRDLVAALAE